jgi:hypothetical protein
MRFKATLFVIILLFAGWGRAAVLEEAAEAAAAEAEEMVAGVEEDEGGVAVTNWTDGYIEVTAVGAVNLALAQSKAHALSQAEETARALAYRKLAERIYGVQVNSKTTVSGAVATSDALTTQTRGLVRDAHEVKVSHEILDDGSILCAVTLSVPMTTARGLAALAAQVPAANAGAPILVGGGTNPPLKAAYTGVVIDATDLPADPALAPTLLTEDGFVVYGAETLGPERVSALGVASYVKTLEQAKEKGAGAQPLVIKALKAVGEYACDLVLPSQIVDILFQLDAQADVLKGGRLVIMTRGLE